MAIPKSTGVKALARMRAEREDFDRREREARRDAAIELGEAVLKSADLALEPAEVAQLIQAVMKHGFEASLALLTPSSQSRKASANGSQQAATDHVS
jgi:hypothetical protein